MMTRPCFVVVHVCECKHLLRKALGHVPGDLKKGLLDVDVVLCARLKEFDSKLIGQRLASCSVDNFLVHHVALVPDEDLEASGNSKLSSEASIHLGGPLTRLPETSTAFFKPAMQHTSTHLLQREERKRMLKASHACVFQRRHGQPGCSCGDVSDLVDVVGSMLLYLPDPVSDVVEALLVRDVVDQENPHRPAVVGCRDRPETLLPSRIPDLKLQPLSLLLNCANLEINSNGGDE